MPGSPKLSKKMAVAGRLIVPERFDDIYYSIPLYKFTEFIGRGSECMKRTGNNS